MSARDKILSKLRAALDEGDATVKARSAAAQARIRTAKQTGPIPKIARTDGMDRVNQFVERAEAVQATVRRIATIEELPGAVSDELRRRNLPAALRMGDDAMLASLDWGAVETSVGPGRLEEPVTLTAAVGGVSETGTLVFRSGPDAPSSLNFLGEAHFVVLRARDIEAGLEGLWRKFRDSGADPRTVNLITGPSRTGDIEQKIELGAHGPVALQIFLIDDY
ncbi:MAG: LUD domain-containing protein [Neomegalonema sp.]|nr:LUD domain-containing protein [Neomegalonema sp.]